MADTRTERSNTTAWAWILGLIVVGLLLWALFAGFNNDEAAIAPVNNEVGEHTVGIDRDRDVAITDEDTLGDDEVVTEDVYDDDRYDND